ncbi:MAG: hypothetical protein IGS38_06300 [Synechococcales cyanobacterium M58_A2018_015]|nr:hypothetical protein [Synechococcales cyanobacterium M58_A2018_015]
MSELITLNPGQTTIPQFRLEIISEKPITAFRDTPTSPIVVIGSEAADTIQAIPGDGQAGSQSRGRRSDGRSQAQNTGGDNRASYRVTGGGGNDLIVTREGFDNISGDDGDDVIRGGGGRDVISGGAGNDNLQGNAGIDIIDAEDGDDIVDGGQGNDMLLGGPGRDRLFGGEGEDTLRGGAGDDTLFGGPGSDNLRGGTGNDILNPGAGRDVMKGGAGRDTFRFEAGSTGAGVGLLDRITDFQPSEDRIELSRALLPGSGLSTGRLSADRFAIVQDLDISSDTEAITEATLIYERKSGIVYYSPANGQDVPLFQLQANLTTISASNFTIF